MIWELEEFMKFMDVLYSRDYYYIKVLKPVMKISKVHYLECFILTYLYVLLLEMMCLSNILDNLTLFTSVRQGFNGGLES